MVLKLDVHTYLRLLLFENDVKTYGTETTQCMKTESRMFENDVKTYGTETDATEVTHTFKFENDVKTYGTETQ